MTGPPRPAFLPQQGRRRQRRTTGTGWCKGRPAQEIDGYLHDAKIIMAMTLAKTATAAYVYNTAIAHGV
jgi:hypothetical protein